MALTRFTFECDGVTIEGEGVVTITGAPAGDPAELIAAFLANLDPQTVEQAALNRQEWGSTGSLAGEIINVISDIAQGKPPQ